MSYRWPCGVALIAFSIPFLSCSFNYTDGLDGAKAYPDMEMSGVSLSRYEDARVSLVLSAGVLELYDSDKVWAGTDIAFTQYAKDKDGKVESEAQAGLVLIDDGASLYSLGDDVRFHVVKDDISVEAPELQWAKKTNRLSGSDSGEVEIREGDGTVLKGVGFFADTLSREYWFSNAVSGDMVKKDDDGDSPKNAPASAAEEPDAAPSGGAR
jgi:hypothetical protein